MTKALEAYFKIDHTLCLNSQNIKFEIDEDEHIDCQNIDEAVNCLETIKEALKRLEAIDNANPSEALECLEKLKGMEISSMPFSDEYGTQEVDLNDIRKVGSQLNTDFREYTATIKQALLKAQEPKHYLKWEDLEFKEDNEAKIKVRMGEHIYDLWYGSYKTGYGTFKQKCSLAGYEFDEDYDIDFFNDLHLERVEE